MILPAALSFASLVMAQPGATPVASPTTPATEPAPTMTTTAAASTPADAGSATASAAPQADSANKAPAGQLSSGDRWTIRVRPRAWFVAPEGDVRLPGSREKVDVQTLDLDELRVAPLGEFNVQAGDLMFSFSGMTTENNAERNAASAFSLGDVDVGDGENFDARLRFSTFNLTAGYKVWQHEFKDDAQPNTLPSRNVLRLWLLGGVRVNDLDFQIRSGDQRDSADDTWIDVVGGVRTEFQLIEFLSAEAEATIGGLSGSSSFDVSFSLNYRPVDWVAAEIGYRILMIDREDGSGLGKFSYDGSFAGLFAGVTFRF